MVLRVVRVAYNGFLLKEKTLSYTPSQTHINEKEHVKRTNITTTTHKQGEQCVEWYFIMAPGNKIVRNKS